MNSAALIFAAVILGAGSAPSTDTERHAADVYRADFEIEADINYDGVPDGWVRRRGPGYPHFAKCEIVEIEDGPSGPRCLKMELDGGAVSISSPAFDLNPRFSFFLEGWVRTAKLVNNVAIARLTLFDEHGRPVMSLTTKPHRENAGWVPLRIGPIAPPESAVRGVITLETPAATKQTDLRGSVFFDDIRLCRLPRMTLTTNADVNVFTSLTAPEVTCRASGVSADQPEVEFQLIDSTGNVLAEQISVLQEIKGGRRDDSQGRVFSGQASWKPPISDHGFYRVRVTMREQNASWLGRETTLVVIRAVDTPDAGELGWSLPPGEPPLGPGPLAQLLTQAGVNWVKCPVWFNGDDTARADRIAWFAERLSIHRIELIGVLDQPPPELREVFRERGELPVASVFIDPDVWQPVVDPVMTRLSLKVRWWQLGGDQDSSFVEFPQVHEKIAEIKHHLERFGQDLRVGINWKWTHAGPTEKESSRAPVRFLTYRAEPDLTATELGDYLDSLPRDQTQRFVQLEPLARGKYSLAVRIQDLVARMLAAKIHQAGAVFVTKPFDDESGLMNADGTPGELFLPWRTTALQLAGTKSLGRFPWTSTNHVFAKDGKATVVAWNETPVRERFYLGEDVIAVDVWGKEVPVVTVDHEGTPMQEFTVGPEPIFLIGLDEYVARWRLETAFENRRLESIFGREQKLILKTLNPYNQAVSGEVILHAPATWEYPKHPLRFRVSENEELRLAIPVTLSQDTPSGPQPVKIEFRMSGGEGARRFTVERWVSVGLEDVTLTVGTRLDEAGDLQTELQFHNYTDRFVSFNCTLFPPDRRRITAQAIDLPPGRSTIKLPIPAAKDLVGKRLPIRAEEIGGPRVLNSSAVAEE